MPLARATSQRAGEPASSDAALREKAIASHAVAEALRLPWGERFRIERKAGQYRMGDPESHYAANRDVEHLTFDTGNNKVLANVGVQGAITTLTLYRESYVAACNPPGWAGVWTAKDASSFGPYSFALEMDGHRHDLASVDWDFQTGLLDNLLPVTRLDDPRQRFSVTLLTFCPLSADGSERPRAAVHGLFLENRSQAPLRGTVHLPRLFAAGRPRNEPWARFDPYEFEMGLGDGEAAVRAVPFDLAPGDDVWVPAVLYNLGEDALDQVNAKGTAGWLTQTLTYYRRVLGRLQTPGDPFLAQFYERQMMGALQAVAMAPSGKLAGSNWGSYPATRQIWIKDLYYSCLPFMGAEPALARKMILWLDEFGVRPPGTIVEGGISHSISLTVASLLLAGLYYDQTGDSSFFAEHPEIRDHWQSRLDAVVATRRDTEVWLFPTRYISDGALDCDYHTGSNVCVWRALTGFSRLLKEVYGDTAMAHHYATIATKVRAAILERTVIDGPFGRQFIEGTYRDGRPPLMISDGEESDTTLMPFYGFLSYADETYRNTMRFSMTEHNLMYNPTVFAISWGGEPIGPLDKRVPATTPGYNKGLCVGTDRESLFGPNGYFTQLRRITDADGSVWWWPYGNPGPVEYGKVTRGVPGKAGWTAGVAATVIVSHFLGIRYDAPRRELHFTPHPAIGGFSWADFPMGHDRFSVSYRQGVATFKNSAAQPVTFAAGSAAPVQVPAGETATVTITKTA